MGLDIYAHRVKKSVADKYGISPMSSHHDIFEALEKEAKKDFKRSTSAMLRHLRKVHNGNNDLGYRNEYGNSSSDCKETLLGMVIIIGI